jgi:putative beta barrel porin BBP7
MAGPGTARAQSGDVPAPSGAAPISVEPCTANPESRFHFRGEYLYWWLREARIPPLVTTGSMESQGILNEHDTTVLYGDDKLQSRHIRYVGTRWTLGYELDPEGTLALEVNAMFLERDSTYFKARSNGDVLLAIPYHDAVTDQETSEVFAGLDPNRGLLSGAYCGYTKIEVFSEEASLVHTLYGCEGCRLELLVGGRFLQMRERLDLTAVSKLLPEEAVLFGVEDHFRAHDAFYGGQLGLRGEYRTGLWFINARGEFAVGADQQIIRAFGDRVFHTPLERTTQDFGLFVQESNAGRHERWRFDVAAEVGINVGCQVTAAIDVFCGYTFLWWRNPVRPGDQVDRTVNPGAIQTGTFSGVSRPSTQWKEDFFWAQGLSVGAELRW